MSNEPSLLPAQFHRIKKMTVVGGFLDGAVFELDGSLNCLIGPRGSGKSTMLEFIRFGFDLGPSDFHDAAARKKFDNLISKNLAGGRVEIEVETKEGLTYTVCRCVGEEPVVFDHSGDPTDLDLRAGALFRPEIFSQNDVESIADQPSFQLELIDTFCSNEIEESRVAIRKARAEIARNATEVSASSEQIDLLKEEIKTLPAVIDKLKTLAEVKGTNAEEINKAHADKSFRAKELAVADQAADSIRTTGRALKQALDSFKAEAADIYPEGITDGPNAFLMDLHKSSYDTAVKKLDENIGNAFRDLRAALDEMKTLRESMSEENSKYDLKFKQFMEKVNASNTQMKERLTWEKKKTALEQKLRDLIAQKKKHAELQEARQKLLDHLSEVRDRRFNARHKVASMITGKLKGNVRVSVVQNGDRSEYREFLTRCLSGGNLRQNVVSEKISSEIPPAELVKILRAKDEEALADRSGINLDQASKVMMAMGSKKVILELETVGLDDLPKVELKDGANYKEAGDLSTGQKCTTILPILMLESENPLLIDQPEDNLDNSFVYSDIVKSIQYVKNLRQLVFVTHNPNIPVLGDAERVFVLQSTGKKGSILRSGTVDDCKGDIVNLLEGGKEAFNKRQERYGY